MAQCSSTENGFGTVVLSIDKRENEMLQDAQSDCLTADKFRGSVTSGLNSRERKQDSEHI